VKRKQWLLLLVLIVAVLLLTGCGVDRGGVDDFSTAQPDGLWQTFVVWPLAKALIWMDNLLQDAGIPYHWGFAIIVFTLIIKLITFPLTLTQIRGMQAQKELQPKIQELQKKYGKDREKLSRAQMELYQEAGVNPLSGCLPLVIQMPILFGLYSALVALGPSLVDASFFWIPDLGFPQYTQGLSWISGLWEAGTSVPPELTHLGRSGYSLLAAYLVLPVLLVVTQFIMQKWMTPATPGDGAQANMTKQIGLMMTFMFGFFTLQVPAGLTLYWVTSNLLQMLQQWAVTTDRFSLSKTGSTTARLETKTATSGNGDAGATTVDGTAEVVANANGSDADTSSKSKRRKSKKKR
jgi:YidC/Oxa1 family membrane protein insertase